MHYVYILQSSNGYYVGYSSDLNKRISQHKNKEVQTTSHSNYELVYYFAFKTKEKALNFEKYLKSGSGFAFRNKRLI